MAYKVTGELKRNGDSKKLILILHAYLFSPSKMLHVSKAVEEAFDDADIFNPKLPASIFSFASPIEIIFQLISKIDSFWEERKKRKDGESYKEIIIIGHSLGALLGRKLYVYACGETENNLFEKEAREVCREKQEWADKVTRIILLAGMNRGWKISYHMSLFHSISWTVGVTLGNIAFYVFKKHPLIYHIRRGSPFVTNLRIQWLAMKKQADNQRDKDKLIVVQLLGSVDDVVGPDDNVDLVSGGDFYYIDVPMSDHANVIKMDTTEAGKERKKVFQKALTCSIEELSEQYGLLPEDFKNLPLRNKRPDVEQVVFVIHGIRDLGHWTTKIARRIKELGRKKNITIESETSTYGYFPLLSFLLPWKRREKVEWLMDQYTEALAIYPDAKFSYFGHSHGTYLFAKALEEYPSCTFKNVVFAGSVVRTDYNWSERIEDGQVEAILNYVATGDAVVAIFPKAFQIIGFQDLGSAGHDGFHENRSVYNVKFVKGDHGAALDELNWNSIADFIVNGRGGRGERRREYPEKILKGKRSLGVIILGFLSPLIWLIILVALGYIGYLLFEKTNWAEWQITTMILFFYLWGIYQILTKF